MRRLKRLGARSKTDLNRVRRQAKQYGFSMGRHFGYYLGRCEAIIRHISPLPDRNWNIKVLYVAKGFVLPYTAIDNAIIDGLRAIVREVEIFNWKPGVPMQPDLAEFAIAAQPDLVLVLEGHTMDVAQIDRIREAGIRTAVWLTDDPYYTDITAAIVPHYDYIFTLELSCLEFYRQLGCTQVHYLPFAADVRIFRPLHVDFSRRRDVCFLGNAFWNRVKLFDQVAPYLASKNTYISGFWWKRLKKYRILANNIDLNRWLVPEESNVMYNASRIALNLHRAHDDNTLNSNSRQIPALSPNPRVFEIAACGTMQLTDIREDLGRFFTPGEEIVTYASPQEMIEKIEYYLHHEDERQAIALRALHRTLREHTYPKRLAQMLQVVFG
ncbi:MAG: CgeB family protein [Bacillota bacterium]